MNNQYKRTLEKVKLDKTSKNKLKNTLKNQKESRHSYVFLKYAAVLTVFALAFLWLIQMFPQNQDETIYVLSFSNSYYPKDEFIAKFIIDESEDIWEDYTKTLNLVQIESMESYILNKKVYSEIVAKDLTSSNKVEFTSPGGTIDKEDWDEEIQIEIEDYKDEQRIKILTNNGVDIEIGGLYFVDLFSAEEVKIHKARKIENHYEIYIDKTKEWKKMEE